MLTTAELNAMRDTAELALPSTAVIQGVTITSDGGGGHTEGWASGGTVACRVAPLNGAEREIGERISADADSIVTLPWDAAVTTNSRLIVGGGTFNVEAVRDRDYEITTRVEASKQV